MNKIFITFIVAFNIIFFANMVYSAPVKWDVNGHYYEVIDVSAVTWQEAKILAESMGGYLATITSTEENLWITNTFTYSNIDAHYLGGFQQPDASAPNVDWSWVTGEIWSYTNWASGEPNDNFGALDETVLHFNHGINADGGQWNDSLASATSPGYIVEYNSPIVPEPISSILFITGGATLGFRRFRKQFKK